MAAKVGGRLCLQDRPQKAVRVQPQHEQHAQQRELIRSGELGRPRHVVRVRGVRAVREVSGGSAGQRLEARQGFDGLLESVKSKARAKRLGWKPVCSGGGQAAYEAFINAMSTNPDAINVLLVDSEAPIAHSPAALL